MPEAGDGCLVSHLPLSVANCSKSASFQNNKCETLPTALGNVWRNCCSNCRIAGARGSCTVLSCGLSVNPTGSSCWQWITNASELTLNSCWTSQSQTDSHNPASGSSDLCDYWYQRCIFMVPLQCHWNCEKSKNPPKTCLVLENEGIALFWPGCCSEILSSAHCPGVQRKSFHHTSLFTGFFRYSYSQHLWLGLQLVCELAEVWVSWRWNR